MKKSQEEIANLKQNWLNDPCWDIENTEGFSEHYEELKKFRLLQEKITANITEITKWAVIENIVTILVSTCLFVWTQNGWFFLLLLNLNIKKTTSKYIK